MLSKSRLSAIARLKYIEFYGEPFCRRCGSAPADVHHIDRDKTNNSKNNLRAYCRSCHITIHNRKEQRRFREYYPLEKQGSIWIIKRRGHAVSRDKNGCFMTNRDVAKAYSRELLNEDRKKQAA